MNNNQIELLEEIKPILIEYSDVLNTLTELAPLDGYIDSVLGLILVLRRDLLRMIEKIDKSRFK